MSASTVRSFAGDIYRGHRIHVGTGYFDQVNLAISGGETSTTALDGSTEEEQF